MAKSMHLLMLINCLMLLLSAFQSTLATSFLPSSPSLNHDDECTALFLFNNSMSINYSASSDSHAYTKTASWKLNGPKGGPEPICCLWDGVECNSGHVIGLDLSSSYLYGPINSNSTLFNLIHLHTLNLADNAFRFSQISSGIQRLSQLTNLNLSYSCFSGQVPKEISHLRRLVSLDLRGNQLELKSLDFQNLVQNSSETIRELFLSKVNIDSEIPDILANSSLLTSLVLSNCGLRGEFPTGLFNLTTLQVIDVQGNNNLTGYLPNFQGKSQLKRLILAETKFHGMIPVSIGSLIHLNELHLSSFSFEGPLPGSLSNLTQLTRLNLGNNKFTGQIPSLERLSNLRYLFLKSSEFDQWKLPHWLGKLNKLTNLSLSSVHLYGEIPSSISNLTQLEELNLASNKIDGPIPPFPSTMTKLTSLNLAYNRLNGPIPSSLWNLENLEQIFFNVNNISGMVEVDSFLPLKKLKALYLGRNKITISVKNSHTINTPPMFEILRLESCNLRVFPDFLRSQDQLQELYLDGNDIDGLIPEWVGNISKNTLKTLSLSQNSLTGFEKHWPVLPWASLQLLDLSHNMLHGLIPVPPPSTKNLLISNNKLTGEFPGSICDLKSLLALDLSFNNISGLIPPCLDKLSNSLSVLNLRGNALQGIIPNNFPYGSKLKMINFRENQLEGQLPRSLENCTSLQVLDVGNNQIEDIFPFWLGALSELNVLILRANKFHGAVRIASKTNSKFPKLGIIDLSYNSFSGELPQQYFHEWSAMKKTKTNATYMQASIDILLSDYMWIGNYSYSMTMNNKGITTEYEKVINILKAVDLSSNKFEGMIPESIIDLNGLKLLNLSNNDLTGVIPRLMGDLRDLESLDLSNNKLSGKIPRELSQLNFLAVFNVSYNNLSGIIPSGGQFNSFMNTSYIGNLAMCGDPLSKKCEMSEISKPPTVSSDKDIESEFPCRADWVATLLGVGSGLLIWVFFGKHLTTRYNKWFLKNSKTKEGDKNKSEGINGWEGSFKFLCQDSLIENRSYETFEYVGA